MNPSIVVAVASITSVVFGWHHSLERTGLAIVNDNQLMQSLGISKNEFEVAQEFLQEQKDLYFRGVCSGLIDGQQKTLFWRNASEQLTETLPQSKRHVFDHARRVYRFSNHTKTPKISRLVSIARRGEIKITQEQYKKIEAANRMWLLHAASSTESIPIAELSQALSHVSDEWDEQFELRNLLNEVQLPIWNKMELRRELFYGGPAVILQGNAQWLDLTQIQVEQIRKLTRDERFRSRFGNLEAIKKLEGILDQDQQELLFRKSGIDLSTFMSDE